MQIIVAGHNGPHVACLRDHTKRTEIGGHGAMAIGEPVWNGFNFDWHDSFYTRRH